LTSDHAAAADAAEEDDDDDDDDDCVCEANGQTAVNTEQQRSINYTSH